MPHGDLSDITSLAFLAVGSQVCYDPTMDVGPIKALVSGGQEDAVLAMRIIGAIFLLIFTALFNVRWNSAHKLVGLGFFGVGGFLGFQASKRAMQPALILYSALFLVAGFHVTFLANKTYKAMCKEKGIEWPLGRKKTN